MKKRVLGLLLVLLLLVQLFPATVLAEEEPFFAFAAATGEKILIAPAKVAYSGDESVAQALKNSGYDLDGLDSGFVTKIQGVAGNYRRVDDKGGVALDQPAKSITFLVFIEYDVQEETTAAFGSLIKAMVSYNTAGNGVENYAPAQQAYHAAEAALLGAGADAVTLEKNLSDAMKRYDEEILHGSKVTAALTVQTLDGKSVPDYTLDTADAYGRTAQFHAGEAVELVPGAYTFALTDGKGGQAAGSMTLTDEGKVQIGGQQTDALCLPDGSWLGEPVLHNGSMASGRYEQDGDTFYVADSETSPYLYLSKGDAIGERSISAVAVYCSSSGKNTELAVAWESQTARLTDALAAGTEGGTVTLRAVYAYQGYEVRQSCTLHLERTPTLAGLSVLSSGAEQLPGFKPEQMRYTFNVASQEILITPYTRNGAYTVTIDGKAAAAGESFSRSLTLGSNSVDVKLTLANGRSKTYTLNVGRVAAKTVTILHDADLQVQVLDRNGQTITPASDDGSKAVYPLLPQNNYQYVARKGVFAVTESFSAMSDQTITAKRPIEEDWLDSLQICAGSAKTAAGTYLDAAAFQPAKHSYTIQFPDTSSTVYVWAMSDTASQIKLLETGISVSVRSLTSSGKAVHGLLSADGVWKTMTLRLTKTQDGCTYTQDYMVEVRRRLSLKTLTLEIDGEAMEIHPLVNGQLQENKNFDKAILSYQADLLTTAQTAKVTAAAYAPQAVIQVNGTAYDGRALTLDPKQQVETLTVTLCDSATGTPSQSYTIRLSKREPLKAVFTVTDQSDGALPDGVTAVYNKKTGERIIPNDDQTFPLVDGTVYRYVATCLGYVGKTGEVTAGAENCQIRIALQKAPAASYGSGITSDWPDFRGGTDNNGLVSAKTPIESEKAMLSWATKLGNSYGSGATGCPILITQDGWDYVVAYAGNSIVKVDALSGKVVASGIMKTNSSFAINSATYGGGMIFVALSGGCVQAFDAKTLNSLWVYTDALGGQPNCPIVYRDGYLYTGFWNGEEKTQANFVCLTATDEVTGTDTEAKLPVWNCTVEGGFYWAGAYVGQNYLLVGTDDGAGGYTSPTGGLLCLDPRTGLEFDSLHDLIGDVRSSVSYDSGTNRYYFTSKGGYFYSVGVEAQDGGYRLTDLKSLRLENGSGGTAMSTSTPVVYNGRAYIGVSGTGQFTPYSGHNITVIDIPSWTIAYRVTTQGYPQTSGMLTTGYDDGYAYVYFFDNYTPGKLRVIKDKPGVTEPLIYTKETNNGNAYFTGKVIFTPNGSQAQYAICSPICDSYGNIYFKNDSAYMMALSNTIESIDLLQGPAKTLYRPGEQFDPAGMIVRLNYSNGTSRVVPATRGKISYLAGTGTALKEGETETEVHFLYTMYQNREGNLNRSEPGKPYASPTVKVPISVQSEQPEPPEPEITYGDLNGDGKVNALDLILMKRYLAKKATFDADQLAAADLNGDSKVNALDLILLKRYLAKKIDQFPAQK